MNQTNSRYDAIEGLRAFSAIGIVLMHVRANGNFEIGGFVYNRLIPSVTNLVFLFMVLSAFGLCCGYYVKIQNGSFSTENFYLKRYEKVLPYFALLCVLDVVLSPSQGAMIELFANLTLCFGFLPQAGNISVIGVGWFLGIIFAFYFVFSFFCFLIANKKRAWFSFAIAYLFDLLCAEYFNVSRTNLLYCGVFLLAGGIIYLYREQLSHFSERYHAVVAAICLMLAASYYILGDSLTIIILLFSAVLIYALGIKRGGVLQNRFTRFLSSISMEIYLCHMVVFRGLERVGLIHLFELDGMSYIIAATGTIAGAVLFAGITKWCMNKIGAEIKAQKIKEI